MRTSVSSLRSALFSGLIAIAACTKQAPSTAPTDVEIPHSAPSTSATERASTIASADSSERDSTAKVVGHTLTISPNGFMQSCLSRPVVTIAETDGGTRVVDQSLPGKGNYFLDGTYAGYGMCDLVVCNPASDQPVDLVEYEKNGARPRPDGHGDAPVYRTVDLKGKITVTLHYFSDDKCSVPKTLTQTVVR
jgi:hypothetical protein